MRLADALKIHNAKHGLYVAPELRKNFTITVRVMTEYTIPIKAPDKDTAREIAGGLVQAGLAGEGKHERIFSIKQGPSDREIERQRQRLFSRGIEDRVFGFSRDMLSRQIQPPGSSSSGSYRIDLNTGERGQITQQDIDTLLGAVMRDGGIEIEASSGDSFDELFNDIFGEQPGQ